MYNNGYQVIANKSILREIENKIVNWCNFNVYDTFDNNNCIAFKMHISNTDKTIVIY